MKCYFYDDGCGNGSYIPASCCNGPACNLFSSVSYPNCGGSFKKCDAKNGEIAKLKTRRILEAEEKLKLLKKGYKSI
jgi:hypothetical protein